MTYEEAVRWLQRHNGQSKWWQDDKGVWRWTVRAEGEENERAARDGSEEAKREEFAAAVHELSIMLRQ